MLADLASQGLLPRLVATLQEGVANEWHAEVRPLDARGSAPLSGLPYSSAALTVPRRSDSPLLARPWPESAAGDSHPG